MKCQIKIIDYVSVICYKTIDTEDVTVSKCQGINIIHIIHHHSSIDNSFFLGQANKLSKSKLYIIEDSIRCLHHVFVSQYARPQLKLLIKTKQTKRASDSDWTANIFIWAPCAARSYVCGIGPMRRSNTAVWSNKPEHVDISIQTEIAVYLKQVLVLVTRLFKKCTYEYM